LKFSGFLTGSEVKAFITFPCGLALFYHYTLDVKILQGKEIVGKTTTMKNSGEQRRLSAISFIITDLPNSELLPAMKLNIILKYGIMTVFTEQKIASRENDFITHRLSRN